ncbi:MAG: ribonuclease III [Deltaproteobacteria bacterium HGW-Deltaproteobacteria-7]|jgi:ribonuclease III|nr:MAG: ribonuclease III [Deltaproteobacteria bacterium HGW-Deltaproteobacteria-7]PKN17244.1 MAG: ribonuclease III [Deltaproteobacteria bacterium HGW-Deltaproteobacteria-6]
MSKDREKRLTALQEKLHYVFRNPDLLSTALTHRSYINENPQPGASDNERLEFLGDAVLGLCVSDLLMKKHADSDEGTLSKIRSLLVNEKPLADLAVKLNLGECLLLGKGEENSGGRAKESLLANALEAVIAAIYLDSGFSKTKTFLKQLMKPLLNDETLNLQCFDYKTALQELCQRKYKSAPLYTVLDSSGPDHDKTFEVEVVAGGDIRQIGRGKNKKDAQKQAAQKAWESLHE